MDNSTVKMWTTLPVVIIGSSIWILLLFGCHVHADGLSIGPPPAMLLVNPQQIRRPASTPVGTIVGSATVGMMIAGPGEKDSYPYSISAKKPEFDGYFAIDAKTGYITVNRSLADLVKQGPVDFSILPTVFNGKMRSSTEIPVHIYPDNTPDSNTVLFPFLPPLPFTSPPAVPVPSSSLPTPNTPEAETTNPVPSLQPERDNNNLPISGLEPGGKQNVDDEERGRLDRPPEKGRDQYYYLFFILGGVVLLAALVGGWYCCIRRKRHQCKEKLSISKSFSSETGQSICKEDHFLGKGSYPDFTKSPLQMVVSNNRYLFRRRSGDRSANTIQTGPDGYLHPVIPEETWEFPRENVKILTIVGEGCFGQVYKAEAEEPCGNITTVAVKMLKDHATEKDKHDLLAELNVMKGLEFHPNIVQLLGCCTTQDPVMVIMEYVSLGKLQSLLRRSRNGHYYGNVVDGDNALTPQELTSFGYQVARAMQYLSNRGILHRDLAARNILVDEGRICKVCDFGLARDVIDSHIYERKSEGRLPVRWMAPESLCDNIFSTKTDVWSFGILLWEIVTLGSTPYPGMSAREVMMKICETDYRLEQPSHCKRELYNIMYYCWNKNPEVRPDFSELVQRLGNLLEADQDYLDLNNYPENSYYNTIITEVSDEKV